ncbi:unnamed protein product [Auanema sp. JU1783]|nr:unnamed protein product [Auanema sp. JU1783]
MYCTMDEKIRNSQFRAEFKTKAHQHCMKRLKFYVHNFSTSGLNDNSLVEEEICKTTWINDYLKAVKSHSKEVHGLRRSLSACNINEKRNKYIVNESIPDATKTLWPMEPKLMQEADDFIAHKLGLFNTEAETPEHMETVGNHIVELGTIYGPERFYVRTPGTSEDEISRTLANFNINPRKIQEMTAVSTLTELPSPSLLAFCNETDQVLRRVCYMKDKNNNGFYLYDFDYGNVCHMDSFDYLSLKHLPADLCVYQPLYSPVRLVNKVSELDFTRYINNLRKTGFLYIVGFVGPEVQAAITSELQMPNPCRRFCDYLYCQGDCFLIYEEKQMRRQNPHM